MGNPVYANEISLLEPYNLEKEMQLLKLEIHTTMFTLAEGFVVAIDETSRGATLMRCLSSSSSEDIIGADCSWLWKVIFLSSWWLNGHSGGHSDEHMCGEQ